MNNKATAEYGLRVMDEDRLLRMFDLHHDVLRANRQLDRLFPPFTGEHFAAIQDGAERLRDTAEALRALLADAPLAFAGGSDE